jgi:hypothetical protein
MVPHFRVLIALLAVFLWPSLSRGDVRPLFDLTHPNRNPFPSDYFTVEDQTHLTGRRVNLPKPDCSERRSDCEDIDVINTLDGFNPQPRLSIPFDGPIDVETAKSSTVFLISLGSTVSHGDRGGRIIGINQVVWDPATNTLHAESDEFLDQHTRYALIVTRRVRDLLGAPVQAPGTFRRFMYEPTNDRALEEYRIALIEALFAVIRAGMRDTDIVMASVFTTQSVTAILEKIRDQIKAATPDRADFNLGTGGIRTVFRVDEVTGITVRQQTAPNPPSFTNSQVNLGSLRIIPGAVGQVTFGKYFSPDYETDEQIIPPVGTRTGTPVVQRMNEIYFNLYLPSGQRPAGGWPVAIFGHGDGGNKQGVNTVASLAAHGIATIIINTVGHGFGPLGTLTVNRTVGDPVTLSAGGRGIDQNGDGVIGNNEGIRSAGSWAIINLRDGLRQTVVDLMQLVRVIEVGVDVDGDGASDLDPARVYYFGHSLGGLYGTIFLGVEPAARAGVLSTAGGSLVESGRLSVVSRPAVGGGLAARSPSLINPHGLTEIGGVPVGPPHFNENKPLRNEPPVINMVAGAMAIQTELENREWARPSGDPLAYAPHLRKAPLAGMPAKSIIFQFAKGDRTITNPTTTALLRAGDLADRATFYWHDLAFAEDPRIGAGTSHGFVIAVVSANALVRAIALGAQEQVAVFFASDGTTIIHPEPARFFEVPIALPLPEGLNYIQ